MRIFHAAPLRFCFDIICVIFRHVVCAITRHAAYAFLRHGFLTPDAGAFDVIDFAIFCAAPLDAADAHIA